MSQAATADQRPLDPDDELLVAYLDGELGRQEQTALENRLLAEEPLRARLQQLQSGWDLLDDLPDPTPSTKLVESTLELVVADILKSAPRQQSWWRRYQGSLLVAALCLLGAGAAWGGTTLYRSYQYQNELSDLAIVENLDAYRYGSDLDLMRQLSAHAAWAQMVVAAREVGDIRIATNHVSAMPVPQREQAVRELPLEARDMLYLRWERFTRMDDATRQQIRTTADAVAKQPDAEFLLRTMKAYASWRETLKPDQLRDRIEQSADEAVRREAINEAVDATMVSISKRASSQLDDETIERIYYVLEQILQQRMKDRDAAAIRQWERIEKFGVDDPRWGVLAQLFGPQDWQRGRRGSPGRGDESGAPLQPDELAMIQLILPSAALDTLDLISNGDLLSEVMTLRLFAEEAIRRKSPFRNRTDVTSLERYNQLLPSARDEIDLMPPDKILRELTRD